EPLPAAPALEKATCLCLVDSRIVVGGTVKVPTSGVLPDSRGLALVRSLAQESLVVAASGALVGLALARLFVAGSSVRIAMSAFALDVDAVAILVGFAGALFVGVIGTAPAATRVLRMPIAAALKEP
ncbi:MAG: hypothetical protein ACKO4Q_08855, partial [Planctomycetota bacterium]